jgi:hypothetical protein
LCYKRCELGIYYHFRYQVTKRDWLDAGYGVGDDASEAFEDLVGRERGALPIANYLAERLPDGKVEKIDSGLLRRKSAQSS